jgi:hypothetical protein
MSPAIVLEGNSAKFHNISDNHFKGIQKNRKALQLDDYIKAGKIAAEVREIVRERNWVGKTVYEICEEVENQIKKRGAKCAFPVNVSINEIAAHYTAETNDPITITDSDLVKIVLGTQSNGYIADTAVTVCQDAQSEGLIQAAEEALSNAMSSRPKRCTVASTMPLTADSSVMSAAWHATPSPSSWASACRGSASTSMSMTCAPSLTNSRAAAAPMPRAAPVINATLPSSLPISSHSL